MVINTKSHKLKIIRIKKGLSGNELAKRAKLSTATVFFVENARIHPSPKTAAKICKVLDVPFDNIFEIQPDTPKENDKKEV